MITLAPKFKELCGNRTSDVDYALYVGKSAAVTFDYLDIIVDEGRIFLSYLPKNRDVPIGSPDFWTHKYRQKQRPISVLRKLLPQFSTNQLDAWLDSIKVQLIPPECEIKLVSGNDIKEVYRESNYIRIGGSSVLEKSCMRYDKTLPYLELYARNRAVKCAYVDVDGKVAARALVWEGRINRTSISILDRTYFYTEVYNSLLNKWAEENLDYIRMHNAAAFKVCKADLFKYLEIQIPLNFVDLDYYPYVDTFRYLKNRSLTNVRNYQNTVATLQSTEGLYSLQIRRSEEVDKNMVLADSHGWVVKSEAVLYKDTYYLANAVTFCAACGIGSRSGDIPKYDGIAICHKHSEIEIKGVLHKICSYHKRLFTEECEECAKLPTCILCPTRLYSKIKTKDGNVCPACCEMFYTSCTYCGVKHKTELLTSTDNGSAYCEECRNKYFSPCDECETLTETRKRAVYKDKSLCSSCVDKLPSCKSCGESSIRTKLNTDGYCSRCLRNGAYVCACPCGGEGCRNRVTSTDSLCEECA